MKASAITGTLMFGTCLLVGSTSLACSNCARHAQVDRLAMAGRGILPAAEQSDPQSAEAVTKQERKLKPQETCPIMGAPIDLERYVDHDGKRIHVCCPPCLDAVKADPAAAVATLAERGEAPRQALCPIMNLPIDPKLYVDHEGQRIYVCCAGCVAAVENDPEAALKKLRDQGVAPAKAGDEPAAEKPDAREQQHHHHHH